MSNPSMGQDVKLEQWLSAISRMRLPTVITCDFDGTLTPRFPNDEDHFTHVGRTGQQTIAGFLGDRERIGGVCTSRSILEVKRILETGFINDRAQDLSGLSAAENGAVVFCRKLSPILEQKLTENGFQIDTRFAGLTAINLAKVSPEALRESIVFPAVGESRIDQLQWSSSVGENHLRPNLQRLFEMSKHDSLQRTEEACQRFGSAYVKVYNTDDGKGETLIKLLERRASEAGVLCLVTPPIEGHPIWTADLGGGVTKYDAMKSISQIYSALAGIPEAAMRFLYFGDGENDLPAFQYIFERPGNENHGFLLDIPHGNNDERFRRVATGTVYLKGDYDLAGVAKGVQSVCGS
ncbi:MAG: hypothetical protein ACK5HO_13730 [Pseudomonadota bacterium]|jgi:hydroxymethylpyrimidine pyrophosphatase-like HAD family hydrolase